MESVTETDLAEIENKIQKYLDFFRKKFPEALLPKHHLLEDHVLEWMEKWRFGKSLSKASIYNERTSHTNSSRNPKSN